MKKRGPAIGLAGVGLTISSFLAVLMIFPAVPTLSEDIIFSNMFEDMFNQISQESIIFPNHPTSFSYSPSKPEVPLLWGMHIVDFQRSDQYTINVIDTFGGGIIYKLSIK